MKKFLSGCPVTVTVSQSVTETPQDSVNDEMSQSVSSHQEAYIDWLTGGMRSKYHPPTFKFGRVGVSQSDSLNLQETVDPASDSTDDEVDKVKVDESYNATVEVQKEPTTW